MIVGHRKQREFLKKIVKSGKIPHALLFSGPEKLGKKTLALELISSLFQEDPFQHPDFLLTDPIDNKISINQIRDLNWRLSLKSLKASFKTTIIDQAHLMTKEAQNCLLKTLEEPKGKTLLILITGHQNLLLPTILSRCQIIKFYPVKSEEIRDFLRKKGILKEEIEKIVKISLGRPGIAIDFLENPQKLKERETKIKELIKISNSPLALRFQYVKKLSKSQDLKEVLNIWLSYFREVLIRQRDKTFGVKTGNILKTLEKTIFLISTTNVNSRLALEILMLEL